MPDTTTIPGLYPYPYMYSPGSPLEYAEGIALLNGFTGNAYIHNSSTLNISNVGSSTRFTGTQATSNEEFNRSGFVVKFNAGSFKYRWYGSDCATGIGFVDVTEFGNYDFSLDAACENCNSKLSDSKSMVIQDTTDWASILKSSTVDNGLCKNVKNYFYKSSAKTYCREEYHVYYPNANNRIEVELGRFFTLNEDKTSLDLIDSSIPNYAPIKVVKTRQCMGGNLNDFKKSSDTEFQICGGRIAVNYNDNSVNGNYKYNDFLVSKLSSFTSSIKNTSYKNNGTTVNAKMLEQRGVFLYTLKDNVYRYVRIVDGFSMMNKPSDLDKGLYIDSKISNLPVSFELKKNPSISFRYYLPNNSTVCGDSNSKIAKAYIKDNNYLKCVDDEEKINVYSSDYVGNEKRKDTACAKLYNSTTSYKYKNCAKDRTKNKIGNSSNCFNSNNNSKYSCNIQIYKCDETTVGTGNYKDYIWDNEKGKCIKKCSRNGDDYIGPDGEPTTSEEYENKCCIKTNHTDFGRDWNEKDHVCCPPGTLYNEILEKCDNPSDTPACTRTTAEKKTSTYDFTDYEWVSNQCCSKNDIIVDSNGNKLCEKCNLNNHIRLKRDWNDNEGKCCPVGYKYYSETKRCEPPAGDKCDLSHLNCADKPCCYDKTGKIYCGERINGKDVCPVPDKPDIAIYRSIDNHSPFISQTGVIRTVGENWCSNSIVGLNKFSCSGLASENPLVYAVIESRTNVNESNAMLIVDLDFEALNKIRKYNETNSYDDFTLSCDENGEACISNFLRGETLEKVDINLSGRCSGVSKNNFYKCS